ncbi:MlaD family protein [Reichenbachiella sp. MALMAid0571]|uniref:MlaD family protein n=1 Tax=Reichenbachiella sp. MALMAid0571 TaxID=3143939 RepID=UPI0032DFDEEA
MSKEFKVGLLAIISGTILYLGFNYLKGKDFFSKTNKYYTIYANIDGLNVSNPVIVNGFSVGRVSAIRIMQEFDNKVLVELDVDENVVLGDSTIATLTNEDFLGSKAILLEIGRVTTPAQNGDTLQSGFDKGLAELFERAQPLTDNIGITIGRINEILIGLEGAGEDVKTVLQTFNQTLLEVNVVLKSNNSKINRTFEQINKLLANIDSKVEKIDPLMDNVNRSLDKVNALELEATLSTLNGTMNELKLVISTINNGDGTVSKLLKEDSLYQNINKAMIDLDLLLVHFNEYPRHFMAPLGKKKKKIDKEMNK